MEKQSHSVLRAMIRNGQWKAVCSCGWRADGTKQETKDAAAEHKAEKA